MARKNSMWFYHFTSLENYEKIMADGNKPNDYIMTIQADRRKQYWAVGEHRDKTEVRLTISPSDYEEFPFPEDDHELRCNLVKLGAMTPRGLSWESEDTEEAREELGHDEPWVDNEVWSEDSTVKYIDPEQYWNYCDCEGLMNWFHGRGTVAEVEIWDKSLRRYVRKK